jgi:hypothetical protein
MSQACAVCLPSQEVNERNGDVTTTISQDCANSSALIDLPFASRLRYDDSMGCRAGNILRTQAINQRFVAIFATFRGMLIALELRMGRDWRVDTLRGYFLVAMTLGHFPNPLARFTEYTFGYASSPDGFIFLSGLVSAWVYLPLGQRSGRSAMVSKIFRRTGTIYLTHIGLLVLGILGAYYAGHRAVHPWQTFISGALLWNQVGFDRILPMYCVFLAFSPMVLKQFTEGRAWLIGGISAGLWVGAQFGLGDARSIAAGLDREGFNLCAWQAYFVAGQYIGYRVVRSRAASVAKSRILLVACVVVSLLLMVDRHLLTLWGINPLFRFDGHPNHNPVRFLDAACLGYLVWWIPRSVDLAAMKLRFFRFLNLLGGHSLQVFAFSLLVTRFEANALKTSSPGLQLFVAILTVLSLGLPARLHQFFRQQSSASTPPRPACAPKTITV